MSKREITDSAQIFTRIVERYAHLLARPEARLRFFNNTLARQTERQKQLHEKLRRFAFIERTLVYRWLLQLELYRLLLDELKRLLPAAHNECRQILRQAGAPPAVRLLLPVLQTPALLWGITLVAVVVAGLGLYSTARWTTRRLSAYRAGFVKAQEGPANATAFAATTATTPGTKHLPGYRPEKVWLVERKGDYEQYSNGGRILTDYETENRPRAYFIMKRGAETVEPHVRHEIAGILYHTSENDLLPFTAANNESINKTTRELLEFVRRHQSYNYVIDRFGQIYRIVRDDHAANHAGHSIWADKNSVYIGLNESFLGVCFETRSDAGAPDEQLTEAQLISGRLLTAILRSRYDIDDANCVTHGIVSVNPAKMLIAYHRDWARNFPFEAMGLSDKYQVAPASISEFGFTYDSFILSQLGGAMWPGVAAAEQEFQRRAEQTQQSPDQLRRRMRDLYLEQIELARKLRLDSPDVAEKTPAGAAPAR
jgi:hypothetical protein